MQKITSAAMAILAAVIFVSFFLPWAHVQSQEVGMFSKILTGKTQAEIASISGFGIPVMANSKDSRLAVSVIKIFNPDVKDADKKAYLVWFMPLFAIAAAVVFFLFNKNKWVGMAVGDICLLIFLVGVFKISTTDMDKLVLNIKIGTGLWLTLIGYLLMSFVGTINFVLLQIKKK